MAIVKWQLQSIFGRARAKRFWSRTNEHNLIMEEQAFHYWPRVFTNSD